jgi:cytochrome c556
MKHALSLALLAGGLALTTASSAQEGPSPAERAYEMREGHMKLYAYNLGPLGAMAKGEMEYDAALAQTHAGNIADYARVDLSSYWVEGSDSMSLEDSRALPAIWDNLQDVAAKQDALLQAAEAAEAAAPEGLDAFRTAFAEVGKSCGACHEDYREPQD